MFVDTEIIVNVFWKDTNTFLSSMTFHLINECVNTSIATNNVNPATMLGYTKKFYTQMADNSIILLVSIISAIALLIVSSCLLSTVIARLMSHDSRASSPSSKLRFVVACRVNLTRGALINRPAFAHSLSPSPTLEQDFEEYLMD